MGCAITALRPLRRATAGATRHAAAGFTALRFTHAQIAYEPQHVKATLEAVAARLAEAL